MEKRKCPEQEWLAGNLGLIGISLIRQDEFDEFIINATLEHIEQILTGVFKEKSPEAIRASKAMDLIRQGFDSVFEDDDNPPIFPKMIEELFPQNLISTEISPILYLMARGLTDNDTNLKKVAVEYQRGMQSFAREVVGKDFQPKNLTMNHLTQAILEGKHFVAEPKIK